MVTHFGLTEAAVPQFNSPCGCKGCGAPYRSGIDLLVPDSNWAPPLKAAARRGVVLARSMATDGIEPAGNDVSRGDSILRLGDSGQVELLAAAARPGREKRRFLASFIGNKDHSPQRRHLFARYSNSSGFLVTSKALDAMKINRESIFCIEARVSRRQNVLSS